MELKTQEQLRKELSAPLPAEAVKPHPTKTFLSAIKAIYVTERMNTVFGIGGWQLRVDVVERAEKGTVVVKTTLNIPAYNIHYECYGGNDNGGETSKNFDLGDAYKGATTDAITKIGSYMEIGIDVFKGKKQAATTATTDFPKSTPAATPPAALTQITEEKFKAMVAAAPTQKDRVKKSMALYSFTPEQKSQLDKLIG